METYPAKSTSMAKKKDFDICVSFFLGGGGDRKRTYKLFFPVCELDNFGDHRGMIKNMKTKISEILQLLDF